MEGNVFQIIYLIMRCIQGLLTIFLNLVTVIIITKYKKLKTPSNVWIVSLSFADMCTGMCVLPNFTEFVIR